MSVESAQYILRARASSGHAWRSGVGAGHWHLHPAHACESANPCAAASLAPVQDCQVKAQRRPQPGKHSEDMYALLEHSGREQVPDCTRQGAGIGGPQASADHTYHVVSNLAARDDNGRLTALKASLTSVMGQDYVLGCKVQFLVPATLTASLLPTIIIFVRHYMTTRYPADVYAWTMHGWRLVCEGGTR